MNLASLRHPVRLYRWYCRAAEVKHSNPAKYRTVFHPQLCCFGKLVIRILEKL